MENKNFFVKDNMLASTLQRFANYILDQVIIYVFIFILFVFLAIIATGAGNQHFLDWMGNISTIESWLIAIVFIILYYGITEMLLSRSLAKFITKTIVVMADGTNPPDAVILKRTFCRLIPFDHFSFLGSPSRGWHDTISETYVVDKGRFDEAIRLFNLPQAASENEIQTDNI